MTGPDNSPRGENRGVAVPVNRPEDFILWPDGTWCYRSELGEMTHMSDDYETHPVDSDRAEDITSPPTSTPR